MTVRFNQKRPFPMRKVLGQLEGYSQTLLVDLPALRHVSRHRQLTARSKEAGGQLFGTIKDDEIYVAKATGPYWGDLRRRSSYRSNRTAAQCAINKMSKQGYLYLGEWHTHAEDSPNASSMDKKAMYSIVEKSSLNSNSLLLLIVGQVPGIKGLGVWSTRGKELCQWNIEFLKK